MFKAVKIFNSTLSLIPKRLNGFSGTTSFSTSRFPKKLDSSVEMQTMSDIKIKIMASLGLELHYTKNPKSREHLLQYEPKLEDLPNRTMNDSFSSAIIPLATDKNLADSYVTLNEKVRYGRLMENMDLFAVWICHKHLYIPSLSPNVSLPYTFVTILVDKIDFTGYVPNIHENIRISGHVSWVGKSSIEVVVWLECVKSDGSLEKLTKALFLMAARNAINSKAAPLNPLIATNEYEQAIIQSGLNRKNRRKMNKETSLFEVLPTQEEQKLMHDNFIKTLPETKIITDQRLLPPNCQWMERTKLVDIDIAFPENRNAHNTVFGGYLMRKALETSRLAALLYVDQHVKTKHVSNITFHRPVSVNSVLKKTSFVTYTEGKFIQVVCIIETREMKENSQPVLTNIFHYTFEAENEVREVLPKTYQENIWNLIGRREFQYCMGMEA